MVYCIGYILTGCVSNHLAWNTHAKIKNVALGMSRDQVVDILGKDYMLDSSSKDGYGKPIEVLAYKSDIDEEYKLTFVNARLTEWHREHTRKYLVKDPTP